MFNPQVDSKSNQLKDITEKFSGGIDVGVLLFLFTKSRYYILLFFSISFMVAFVYLRYSQPFYQSRAVLQVKNDNQANDILKINNLGENTNFLAEAIEQIKSIVFLKRVVEKLEINVSYFSEGTFKNNELYNLSPYNIRVNVKSPFIYGQKIYVMLNESLTAGTIKLGRRTIPFKVNEWLKQDDFDINVFINQRLIHEEIKMILRENKAFYFIVANNDVVTAGLQTKLDVRVQSEMAKTVVIKVTDVNAVKAGDVVNAITEEYLNYDVERKSESSRNIIAFIDDQLGTVYNDLKNSESDLKKFKKEKNIGDRGGREMDSEIMRYSTIEDQLLDLEMEERLITEIQDNITKNKNKTDYYHLISLLTGTEYESMVKSIVQNIQQLLNEKENLLFAVTPASESIRQVNYQLDIQRKLLVDGLNAISLKYKTKYKSLLERSSTVKSKLSQNPDDEVEFSRLTRLYTIREKYYTMLLEKKTEFSISKAGYVSKNIILEKALGPGFKVSPNQRNTLVVALLVSLLLSLTMVFIRYLFHDKIYTLADITKYSEGDVALLGVIPKFSDAIPVSQLVVDKNPKSLISEAFRTIRANLSFINASEGTKIISITSTISGEGKTFVAINIGGVLAFTSKRVIIIDLDMRKPKIHKGFGVPNNVGMSTILTGITSIDECFNDSPMPNLKFITAGPSPPNPSELILSPKLDDVLHRLKSEFDYIVIDNAPVGLVTDGIATIRKADYPIYVLRAGYSRKVFTQVLDRLKSESDVKQLAVVLNDVEVSRKIYSYNYGYGYGYGYGSGYYNEESKKK